MRLGAFARAGSRARSLLALALFVLRAAAARTVGRLAITCGRSRSAPLASLLVFLSFLLLLLVPVAATRLAIALVVAIAVALVVVSIPGVLVARSVAASLSISVSVSVPLSVAIAVSVAARALLGGEAAVAFASPLLVLVGAPLLDVLERLAEARIAHVLLAADVLLDARLRVVDDQKRAAHVAHLHLLLLLLMRGQLELRLQVLAVGLELLALGDLGLRLVDLALLAELLGVAYRRVDLLLDLGDALLLELSGRLLVGRLALRELEALDAALDLALDVHEEAAQEVLVVVLVAEAAVARALLVLCAHRLVVDLVARSEVGARVHEQVVRTEAAQRELAHVVVVEAQRVHASTRTGVTVLAHELVEQLGVRLQCHLLLMLLLGRCAL